MRERDHLRWYRIKTYNENSKKQKNSFATEMPQKWLKKKMREVVEWQWWWSVELKQNKRKKIHKRQEQVASTID